MARSAYLKEPYLSDKYRKARLRVPRSDWKLMFAGKDINVPDAVKKFKATADPGRKQPIRSTQV